MLHPTSISLNFVNFRDTKEHYDINSLESTSLISYNSDTDFVLNLEFSNSKIENNMSQIAIVELEECADPFDIN